LTPDGPLYGYRAGRQTRDTPGIQLCSVGGTPWPTDSSDRNREDDRACLRRVEPALRIDLTLLRILFVVFALVGAAEIVYLILRIVVPNEE